MEFTWDPRNDIDETYHQGQMRLLDDMRMIDLGLK